MVGGKVFADSRYTSVSYTRWSLRFNTREYAESLTENKGGSVFAFITCTKGTTQRHDRKKLYSINSVLNPFSPRRERDS